MKVDFWWTFGVFSGSFSSDFFRCFFLEVCFPKVSQEVGFSQRLPQEVQRGILG